MANITLLSILALAGDKAAALHGAEQDVITASTRVILHGDAALFAATASALEARKGSTAASILSRMRAAWSDAVSARNAAYPEGRKGKATAEQADSALALATPFGNAFRLAVLADAEERSNKAKAVQAATKAKKAATASLPVIAATEAEVIEAAPAPVNASDEAARIMAQGVEFSAAVLIALQAAIAKASGLDHIGDQADQADQAEAEAPAAPKRRNMKKAA